MARQNWPSFLFRGSAVAAAEQRLLEQQALRDGRIAGARHEILALLERLQATQAHQQRLGTQQLPALNRRRETLQAAQAAGDITRLELIEFEAERLALTRDLESARWLAVELHLKLQEASGDALLAESSSTTPAPEPRDP